LRPLRFKTFSQSFESQLGPEYHFNTYVVPVTSSSVALVQIQLGSQLGRRREKKTVLLEEDGLVKKKMAWRRSRWHAEEEDGLEKKQMLDQPGRMQILAQLELEFLP